MLLPQEIEVWYIIPAIRRELTQELLNLGLNQKQIAERLDVTPSAVSQYIKNKRASKIKFDDKIKKEIKQAAKKIAENKSCCIVKETNELCKQISNSGFLMEIQRKFNVRCKECKCI